MAEQTLILHELYLVGEDKPHVMFDKGYKGQNKINMGLPLRLVLHKSGQDNCKLESRRFCGLTSDRIQEESYPLGIKNQAYLRRTWSSDVVTSKNQKAHQIRCFPKNHSHQKIASTFTNKEVKGQLSTTQSSYGDNIAAKFLWGQHCYKEVAQVQGGRALVKGCPLHRCAPRCEHTCIH